MERLPVKSSNIKSIGYDIVTKTLEIEFTTGGVYRYNEVPEEVYNKMSISESKGKFFHTVIKNKFKTIKVETYCECEFKDSDSKGTCINCGLKIYFNPANNSEDIMRETRIQSPVDESVYNKEEKYCICKEPKPTAVLGESEFIGCQLCGKKIK